ncbi:MAG TPA: methyltransferase domain-containing protein [Iamia sp.]|jgi:SAM-dependent methyltransferase|nr:methyltransferase domain-containing protein [Iamia sp.]
MTPDPIFAHPRLAALYDRIDGDRADLDHYEALVDERGARSVLDVGCGTGVLALRLAARGLAVVGVDPAAASLAVARAKPDADRVRWIHGDATTLPPDLAIDLAVMTGNVAQVFTTDEAWAATLAGIHDALRPGGHLVFETRRPEVRAWEGWAGTRGRTDELEWWYDLVAVAEPLVTFRWSFRFTSNGVVLTSDSTLRFRTRAELEASLAEAGFGLDDVRDAPDRPGQEMVVLAHRPG